MFLWPALCDLASEFPEPVISVAVEPKTKAGQERWALRLQNIAEEDPTFKVLMKKPARPSSPVWVSSILEIIVDRLMREFKVEANVGKPQVATAEDDP